ncbi:hypothetical protein [Acidithiobacillus ferrianus]|uniref:hypothetical protein n=1 Tax=Acidithiobacillus ferrianus TaxID=2678518 RepID=UPI0034E581F5
MIKMKPYMLVLAALLAAAPLAAFAETPQVHFIRSTKNWTTIQIGATLPAILMETLPVHPAGAAQEFPVLLQTLKPLPGCRVQGIARWDTTRWIVSENGIDCGKGFQAMSGFLTAGNDGMMGLTPQRGDRVTIVFTQSIKIPR